MIQLIKMSKVWICKFLCIVIKSWVRVNLGMRYEISLILSSLIRSILNIKWRDKLNQALFPFPLKLKWKLEKKRMKKLPPISDEAEQQRFSLMYKRHTVRFCNFSIEFPFSNLVGPISPFFFCQFIFIFDFFLYM